MNRRGKYLSIAGSALVHALLLSILLRAPARPPPPDDARAMVVTLYTGPAPFAASPPAATAPPPSAKRRRPDPPVPPDIPPRYAPPELEQASLGQRDPAHDPVALSVAAAATAASGQACALTGWLQAALQADPQVQAALPLIPRPARSVANALMLWDGGWVPAPERAMAGVAAIRTALISGIRAAPAACQTQTIRGAELMTLTSGSDTTVLAVGAGEWRWADLVSSEWQNSATPNP